MGCYEREQAAIAAGTGQRGDAARAYFAELDKTISDEASCLTHRPDYTKTLFAPENDDIYQEFCRYVDQPEPRYFDTIENPMCIEGWTAAEIYRTMIASNPRIVALEPSPRQKGARVQADVLPERLRQHLSAQWRELRLITWRHAQSHTQH